jgi:endogenous inhibitor of DNA gyrase (YacG/DUF329 family)
MKRLCPICRKPTDSETGADFPFCSERCRLTDLGNWSSEKYVISNPAFDESEEEGRRSNRGSTGQDDDDDQGARR